LSAQLITQEYSDRSNRETVLLSKYYTKVSVTINIGLPNTSSSVTRYQEGRQWQTGFEY